jgi:hypothetical protein
LIETAKEKQLLILNRKKAMDKDYQNKMEERA